MSAERSIRTNFAFYPPEGADGAWDATLESLEAALRQAFPDPTIEHRVSGIHGMTVLDFEVELAQGVWIDGTAALPRPDYAFITLTNVTADEAAVFARWLRDSFVPAPHLVRFASSLVMANGEQEPWPLPAEGGDEEIVGTEAAPCLHRRRVARGAPTDRRAFTAQPLTAVAAPGCPGRIRLGEHGPASVAG
ncbi:hypothetical protein ACLF6K_06650 [Streptomyces xanthophaeus]|uniref:hypothetical protein n=1 Tax=Streptomyces xanthophaeus TaxID=67385 RepID=UPI0039900638